ncbi:MAG TPA: PAS domain-containing sensor histidine kinase [Campylobacterales bacterium]|nr:PAS domain-containing sensor histidine kinase [Campylobacterales bacterium]
MEISLFDAFVRASQYLAIMPLENNAFFEAPTVMVQFFEAKAAFLIVSQKNGEKELVKAIGDMPSSKADVMESLDNSVEYVIENGYFENITKNFDGAKYSFILLPLESENTPPTVLVACFLGGESFSSDALNAYIAVSTLISSTHQKQHVALKNKMILEMAGEGIFGLDRHGLHTFANEAAVSMLGFKAGELLGKHSHRTWHHHRPDGSKYPECECPVSAVLTGRAEQTSGEEYFLRKENGGFDVEFVATPIKEDGAVVGAVVVFRDITEQKALQRELLQINQQLEARVKEEVAARQQQELILMQQSKMAMMGEMIGAIAHQWRQPLNSLAIIVQDVHEAYKFNELTEEYVASFKGTAMSIIQRMSKTIDDFRNYFKPNKQEEEFALESAVEQTLNLVLPQLNNNSITVNFQKEGKHLVCGYKNELEQAILIIISNAKDALLDNKIKNPQIEITINDANNKISLIVEDNGGGVPEAIIDRIFEPYFTTKEQGKGTGIGLYIAKEIVERQMGGKISVENTGCGARFTIILDGCKI